MVDLGTAIATLYPDSRPGVDWLVGDDGGGPRLVAWHLPVEEPTAEQLAGVTAEQVRSARLNRSIVQAVNDTFTSSSPLSVSDRVMTRYMLTLLNDVRQAIGLPRIQEAQHVQGILAAIAAGAGEPVQV